ncbi:MAG TPA: DUF5668 domain-containing protein, partial [Candidatus Saccharibacteria bacterium]|nr:DUF5668 domain-containing protein [Candidatus Saccharibacteria bacterium]
MNTQLSSSIARYITGALIIGIGAAALLDSLNLINFWGWFSSWWPVGFIIAGILIFISDTRNFIWSLAFGAVGVIVLLRNLQVVDVNVFSLIWPIIILAIGVSVLMNRTAVIAKDRKIQDADRLSAIFGGTETTNESQDYQGGSATAILGGISLDLRKAVIKKEATLNVLAICGGIEIKVPENWR